MLLRRNSYRRSQSASVVIDAASAVFDVERASEWPGDGRDNLTAPIVRDEMRSFDQHRCRLTSNPAVSCRRQFVVPL